MNARLLILTSILSVSVASFACSIEDDDDSTSDQQATGSTPPAGGSSSDTSPSLPPTSNAGSPSPSDPSTSSSSSGGAAPSGSSSGGAPSGGTPSGGAPGGGTPSKPSGEVPSSAACQPGAVEETEPNDTVADATDLGNATSFCGVAAAGDVDHFTFVLPADAKSFAWGAKWTGKGKPTITITSEGVTRTSKEDPPFFPGKKYVFTLTGSADPATYAVSLTIER